MQPRNFSYTSVQFFLARAALLISCRVMLLHTCFAFIAIQFKHLIALVLCEINLIMLQCQPTTPQRTQRRTMLSKAQVFQLDLRCASKSPS